MTALLATRNLRLKVPVPTDGQQKKGPSPEEQALVQRAQSGDVQAFEELVRIYRNDVYALSYYFVKNREEAWDISQEVFIKAYRSVKYFRGEASFKSWLLRIAANQCKDQLKKRRLDTVSFDEAIQADAPGAELGPDRKTEANELGAAIQVAIDALPEKHRTAFLLREMEGLSYQEMAEAMACNIGTVMSRLHHARKKLQEALIGMGVVEGNTL